MRIRASIYKEPEPVFMEYGGENDKQIFKSNRHPMGTIHIHFDEDCYITQHDYKRLLKRVELYMHEPITSQLLHKIEHEVERLLDYCSVSIPSKEFNVRVEKTKYFDEIKRV